MAAQQVAAPADLHGATEEEITALETRYAVQLPATYRRYLATMGHRSGRLFTHDHQAVFYRYVLQLTADLRQEYPHEIALPADALVIAGRLGFAWEFIRCNHADDSPVWYFDERDWQARPSHDSVLTWLEAWCTAAEDAIASGYFLQNPRGTAP